MSYFLKKYAVSVLIENPQRASEFLQVKRPAHDEVLPNEWDLPTVTLQKGELPEAAVYRAGFEKLGVYLKPERFMGVNHVKNKTHEAYLMTIKARLVKGNPDVTSARTRTTKYTEQNWADRYNLISNSHPWLTHFSKPHDIEPSLTKTLSDVLVFMHRMYSVKNLIRFRGMPGWDDMDLERWDSVAEHSWRMALLAVVLYPYIQERVDLLKTLKMVLVHDIVELVALDFNSLFKHGEGGGHAFSHKAFEDKYKREMAASEEVFNDLPDELRNEFRDLFQEYITTKAQPEKASPEGRFAYALDKIEGTIQVIDWRAPKKNWKQDYFEKSMKYIFTWAEYDPILKAFCELIRKEGESIVC